MKAFKRSVKFYIMFLLIAAVAAGTQRLVDTAGSIYMCKKDTGYTTSDCFVAFTHGDTKTIFSTYQRGTLIKNMADQEIMHTLDIERKASTVLR